MSKTILVDLERCVGCRTCEMVCSAKHEGAITPFRSRIKVITWENDWEGVPMTCLQCEDARCKAICPVNAISRDETLGRVVIDYGKCVGCRMCVSVCPFGLIRFDDANRRVIKCDLCDGDPECVKFCFYQAIQFKEAGDDRLRVAAAKLSELVRKTI